MDRYQSPEYKRSRLAYIIQCAFGYFVTLLVSDAYLAKLFTSLGLSDGLIGILSSMAALSCLFELLAISLSRRIRSAKKAVITGNVISTFLFLSTYLLPFIQLSRAVRLLCIFGCIGGGYFSLQLVSSIYYQWANSSVSPARRARFSAVKEMVSLLGGIVFTLAVGFCFDHFEQQGNLKAAFLLIASSMLVLNLFSFLSLMFIRRGDPAERSGASESFFSAARSVLRNRDFRNVIILTSIWEIAKYLTLGFMGTFKTTDLLMTVGFIQIINTAACLVRFLLSIPFGIYSDRTSFAKGYRLALCVAAAGFLCNVFACPNVKWPVIVYTVLYSASLAGIGANTHNITYSYVPKEQLVPAMALRNCIAGVCGFAASLIGSCILSAVQNAGNQVLGHTMYGQQLLSLIAFAVTFIAILFSEFVVEKQTVLKQ